MRIYPVFTRNQLKILNQLGPNFISSVEFNLALSKLDGNFIGDQVSFISMVIDFDSFNAREECYPFIERRFIIEFLRMSTDRNLGQPPKRILVAYLSEDFKLFTFSRHEYKISPSQEIYYHEV